MSIFIIASAVLGALYVIASITIINMNYRTIRDLREVLNVLIEERIKLLSEHLNVKQELKAKNLELKQKLDATIVSKGRNLLKGLFSKKIK